jgi:hypothetical protein
VPSIGRDGFPPGVFAIPALDYTQQVYFWAGSPGGLPGFPSLTFGANNAAICGA